ncbi:MAG TPA: hypothetical protein VGZ22_19365 [Isosphaeraceae bacterium]|jgi:hypothetical protein|nr:hypothetical protein [Isosphaeraceae bacterium]
MSIHIHIEKLVLEGLPLGPGQEAQVGAAVRSELARLLAEGGLSRELTARRDVPALAAKLLAVPPPPSARPVQWGQSIARSVYGGLEP